jgi:hypothetical protein
VVAWLRDRWNVSLPESRRPEGLCDHEGMPRGTANRGKTRYAVRLTVPRRGGWRAWGAVRADFERALAGAVDPAIASAEIASELRRGVDYVRVTVAVTVVTTDVADALAISWDAFRSAARDDVTGWEVAAGPVARARHSRSATSRHRMVSACRASRRYRAPSSACRPVVARPGA